MEEDREFKHVCRFCSKSFPCGRSLGGHMRSHMIFINNKSADVQKLAKKKISSAVNNFISTKANTEINGYVLRDNPKKSKKLADSSEDTSLLYEKFSKENGKGILSWKPLFGSSMKSNSEKERASNNTSLEDQDSWTSANQNILTLIGSQSDDETSNPNRRRRSKRRTRYMATTNSSSFSVANNNGSSSISEFEIEQEQEEVAMSLMMLSRDVGPRCGFNSLAKSSDNNSVFLEAEIEVKNFVCKKLKEKKLESGLVDSVNCQFEDRKTEFSASGISRKGSKVNKIRVYVDLFDKNDTVNKSQLQYKFRAQNSEVELGKKSGLDQTKLGSSKNISNKKKIRDSIDPELVSDSLKKSTNDASDAEFYKDTQKRSIFECATCNKIFHSYQALGGHRASHKKIKGYFASNIDHNSENSIETELSPDPTADLDIKLLKSINNENYVDHLVAESDPKDETSYVVKKSHECPICLKVFPSGQALGGHKRSHLLGGTEARNINPTPTIVIENPIPEIRNFLDLNLPAIDEEDNNGHLGLKPWWISSSHKNEALVGLISN